MPSSGIWNVISMGNRLTFVGTLQLYAGVEVTYLKASAVVVYSVHVMTLNFAHEFCRFCTAHVKKFAVMLPVSTSDAGQQEQ